jgi:hypothetical protein
LITFIDYNCNLVCQSISDAGKLTEIGTQYDNVSFFRVTALTAGTMSFDFIDGELFLNLTAADIALDP